MRRLTLLLAGCGVILLAGCCENSAAQSLVLPEYDHSVDSVGALTLQERAEENFTYIKAGPADPGKVGGELLVGSVGAVTGGAMFAFLGYSALSEGDGGGCLGCFDEGGIIGALVGYAVGSNVGCATGVYLVGNSDGETGSYWAAFGGSFLGTLAGGLLSSVMLKGSENDAPAWAALVLITGAQAGGATLCFNATRERRVEVPSGSMLNLRDGKLALAVPRVSVSRNAFNRDCYQVNLFKANF
jgi:hypothetical protein